MPLLGHRSKRSGVQISQGIFLALPTLNIGKRRLNHGTTKNEWLTIAINKLSSLDVGKPLPVVTNIILVRTSCRGFTTPKKNRSESIFINPKKAYTVMR